MLWIWSPSAKFFLLIFAFNRWRPLRVVGFSSKLVGSPLLGPPVGVPSLVQIGCKLKNFSLLLWRRHCVASLPHPGCLLPPWARPYTAFSRPVLPCSQRPKFPQTWLYRDMRLPQLGSVVFWLRVFTQLWNLQDMFKTIWIFDLNSIWEYGGRVGGATLWGHIKTYHWGIQICQGYDAFSSLIFMFENSNSFQTHRICCKQYLDSIWIVFGCRGCWRGGGGGGAPRSGDILS